MSQRILGLILLVVGVLLVGFGLNASESVADSVSETFTGRFTDKTMWYLIGGGVLVVGGAAMAFLGGSAARKT